jgi:5-(carboxyamino)imidazole ribonucleotide mutase
MGSKVDLDYAKKIAEKIGSFGVETVLRIASAHKVPMKALNIIKEYENESCVYITIAGMSNALSGFLDANTDKPVIASPPYSDKFGGMDIFSTLRMPSGVCPMTVLGAAQAALAAVKILASKDDSLRVKVRDYQAKIKNEIEQADQEINK